MDQTTKTTGKQQQQQEDAEFVEICDESENENERKRRVYMEAYVAINVEPRQCGPLVQRLSAESKVLRQQNQPGAIHHVDINHLKRVMRVQQSDNDDLTDKLINGEAAPMMKEAAVSSSYSTKQGAHSKETNDGGKSSSFTTTHMDTRKRKRGTENKLRLDVLIGAASQVDRMFASEHKTNDDDIPIDDVITTWLESKYQVRNVCKVSLPGREPSSEEEWKDYQKIWPTTFFPNKSIEQKQTERHLTNQEVELMRKGMQAALLDAKQQQQQQQQKQDEESLLAQVVVGTVILDPYTGDIVGRAAPERAMQRQLFTTNRQNENNNNPLATSILYAIQSVSRVERECAVKQGMDSDTFQGGQYLCTGYDVFTTVEPTVFEAMALVHSRVRRVVVGCGRTTMRGALTTVKVHALPGTNHKYRAFLCHTNGDLARQCRELLNGKNENSK